LDGKPKHAALIAAMTLIVLLVSEVASLLAITLIRDKGIFYQPSISGAYEEYLLIRDELLGWPAPQNLGTHGEYDLSGSRIIPAFDDPATSKNCVSLYGDSFTWSAEVNNENAWSNVLSTLLDCRVGNFGVGGYGSDQAYLRFMRHVNDDAVVVFLNHLSENILRNVNQFHDLLYAGGAGIGFKPRFIVNDSDELELVTLPLFDRGEYERVVLNPERYLTHEYFAPGGASGVSIATFPYTASILRGLRHFHVKTELRNVPWYIDFYNIEHTSGGLEVTARILAAFHAEALARGKTPIVTIIPTGLDLLYLV
jgi:hypothetical protein